MSESDPERRDISINTRVDVLASITGISPSFSGAVIQQAPAGTRRTYI